MEPFIPLILLFFFYVCIGLPLSKARKKAQERPLPKVPKEAFPEEEAKETTKADVPQRTLNWGSMHVVTGEGEDPCHEEQFRDMPSVLNTELSEPAENTGGLSFGWTGNDIVKGFVYSEILKRKR